MLRRAVAAESELGSKVSGIMALGNLVDDDTMAEVVEERLRQEDARQGFLLDGYPRTLPQAETLAGILARTKGELDQVLLVEVPEEEIVRRNLLRRREDDTEEVIRARLRVYREQTMPLIGYYTGLGILRQVDGNRPIEEVAASLLTLVGVGA
jgi:adenylate kinase